MIFGADFLALPFVTMTHTDRTFTVKLNRLIMTDDDFTRDYTTNIQVTKEYNGDTESESFPFGIYFTDNERPVFEPALPSEIEVKLYDNKGWYGENDWYIYTSPCAYDIDGERVGMVLYGVRDIYEANIQAYQTDCGF